MSTFHYIPRRKRDIGCPRSYGKLRTKCEGFLHAEVKMIILFHKTAGFEM
jgi:hypothetical protein